MIQVQADGTMKTVAPRTVKIMNADGSSKLVRTFDAPSKRKNEGYSEHMPLIVMGGVCIICIVAAIVACFMSRAAPAESENVIVPDIENGLHRQED